MKRVVPFLAIAAAMGLSATTLAAPESVSTLPEGTLRPPSKAPSLVGGGEKTAGYFLKRGQPVPEGFFVDVFGAPEAPGEPLPMITKNSICFTEADQSDTPEWTAHAREQTQATWFRGAMAMPGPTVLHREELIVEGDAARLEIADAWVDARTGGSRSAARYVLPLRKVGSHPLGFVVYAFREGTSVHFLVATPKADGLPERAAHLRHQLRQVAGNTEVASFSGSCGFAHATLDGDRTAGATASFSVTSFVGLDETPASAEGEGDPRFRRPLQAFARLRALQIHTSVSQAESDKMPIFSVSFGLLGKEHRQPI